PCGEDVCPFVFRWLPPAVVRPFFPGDVNAMEFLLTRGVEISAQWSSEPLRRALARFRRDLEMTLNEGDLIPSGRIQLCLVRSLAPEQFSIDLQSSESMIIRAADDLGAIYALLHLSRTALGVTPFWF